MILPARITVRAAATLTIAPARSKGPGLVTPQAERQWQADPVGRVVDASHSDPPRESNMTVSCFIRYQIDPVQRKAFKRFTEARGRISQCCGDDLEKAGSTDGLSRQVMP